MWYIYTLEYYSAIKKNEIMPLAIRYLFPFMSLILAMDPPAQLTQSPGTESHQLTEFSQLMPQVPCDRDKPSPLCSPEVLTHSIREHRVREFFTKR